MKISNTKRNLYCNLLLKIWFYGPLSYSDLLDDIGSYKKRLIFLCNDLRRAGYIRYIRRYARTHNKATIHWVATSKLEELLDGRTSTAEKTQETQEEEKEKEKEEEEKEKEEGG